MRGLPDEEVDSLYLRRAYHSGFQLLYFIEACSREPLISCESATQQEVPRRMAIVQSIAILLLEKVHDARNQGLKESRHLGTTDTSQISFIPARLAIDVVRSK